MCYKFKILRSEKGYALFWIQCTKWLYALFYNSGYTIEVGTTPECYNALSIFMNGFHVGMLAIVNREVKNK